jgi:hypothetical protein
MANFVLLNDFVGEISISQSRYGNDKLNSIITTVEAKILTDLLGDDLYLKLKADLVNNIPQTTKYLNLVNGVTYSVKNIDNIDVNVDYKGIKQMLRYFIYAELIRLQETDNTEVGEVEAKQQNSTRARKTQLNTLISNAYNNGVKLYGKDIEDFTVSIKMHNNEYFYNLVKNNCFNFLYKHITDYPTWQFTPKEYMFLNGYL